jgi:hypothetical protein
MKIEGRDFTPIESRFPGKFVERRVWNNPGAPWTQLKGRYLRSEMNPYLLKLLGMGDAMILATYTIHMSP